MELWGVGFELDQCTQQLDALTEQLKQLEIQASQLAHHPFSLSSAKEVAIGIDQKKWLICYIIELSNSFSFIQ